MPYPGRAAILADVTITPDTDSDQPAVLNAGRLWAGGVATALVAALIVVAGVYIARSILGIAVLAPAAAGSFGTAATAVYAIFAAAAALAATGLLHLLLLGAPRPMAFFTWITGLATVVAVVSPFGQSAPLPDKVFTAIINLVAGAAIISLLSGVARSSVHQLPAGRDRPDLPPGPMGPAGPIRQTDRESESAGRRRVPPDGA
jgi:hypothetical protein